MNKNDLISAVADSSGLSKSDASSAVEGVFDAITKALSSGDGEPMTIKASNQPKFKAGKGLKDSVN